MRRSLWLGALVALSGCGGDPDDVAATGGSYVLPDGVEVAVAPSGRVELRRGGVGFWGMSDEPITLRSYEQTVQSLLGGWSFTRDAEQRRELTRLSRSGLDGDQVEIVVSGDGGQARMRACAFGRYEPAPPGSRSSRAPRAQ
jgi:hypothetical protein